MSIKKSEMAKIKNKSEIHYIKLAFIPTSQITLDYY
jgi:hypothetical protein